MAKKLGVTSNYVGMLEGGREPGPTLMKLFEKLEEESGGTMIRESGSAYRTPQRLMREARVAKGWSFKDLSRATGYKADVLQAIEEGNGKASEKMIEAICASLSLEKDDLLAGQIPEANGIHGTHGAKPNVEIIGGGIVPKYVPLISMAQAGAMTGTSFTDGGYEHEGTLAFDVRDNRAFGLKIAGDSMQPVYSPGDIAVVYPSHQPRSGDHVIARLSDEAGGDVLFKIYTPKEAGRKLVLSSYNPAFPPVELERTQVLWIYPVVSVTKTLRRL